MERECRQCLTREGPADALDDKIYASASRDAGDAVGQALGREIDDIVKPKGTCLLGLGRVGGRRDRLAGALRSSQLGDRIADRAPDGRRQDRLARFEARLG